MGDVIDRHLSLCHALEKRRLHLGAGAIELVGKYDMGEYRTMLEAEGAALWFKDIHSQDI